jgi:two-component system, NarL family, response regulator NreC
MSIKILLADDHKIVREGLRMLLSKQSDFEILGEANTGRSAVTLALQLIPDVIIMDITMPDLNGIDATEQLMKKLPALKIIGLSMHFDKRFITKMLKAGASGYLRKACASDDIILAIQTVLAGKFFIGDGSSNMTINDKQQYLENTIQSNTEALTTRERELLQLIAEGKLTKEISEILRISIKTVEKHREHLMKKLNMRNLTELIRYAIKEGIIALDE